MTVLVLPLWLQILNATLAVYCIEKEFVWPLIKRRLRRCKPAKPAAMPPQ